MKIKRENVEIRDQKHEMWAEGLCDERPSTYEIRMFLVWEGVGYRAKNIEISFDKIISMWRWICDIEKL